MQKSEFLDRLQEGKLSRRQVSKILLGAGMALTTIPLTRKVARADDEAIYFTWSGYDDPGFFPAYVKKHGANPQMPVFADSEEARTKIQNGFVVDIDHPCSTDVKRWTDTNLLQAIDTSRLSAWGTVFPQLKSLPNTQIDGKQFFIPIDWGNTSILYRPDLVEIQEESWTLLWDERYKGQLSMAADGTSSVPLAGIVAGAKNPFAMTDAEVAKTKELLVKQKPLLRFYWDSNSTVEQALASGELVASDGWNSSVVALQGQGVPIKFMNPKEGIMSYCCGLVLTKNAPHLDKAYDLIDAMLQPEAGKWLVTAMGYGHSNKATFDALTEDELKAVNLPRDPTVFFEKSIFQEYIPNTDVIQKMFEEVKAGA
jgi:spermidine/putrescine transport system substrate-binding protein